MARGIPNDPTKRKGAAVPQEQPGQIPAEGYTLPAALKGQRGAVLLLDACNVYGVNPDQSLPLFAGRGTGPFRELLAWRFYPGDPTADVPDAVVFVTVGGVKVRHYADPDYPMDQDTETRLRSVFHAFRVNPKTNEVEPLPLPDDLTLPKSAVSAVGSLSTEHVFRGGYLRRKRDDAAKPARA